METFDPLAQLATSATEDALARFVRENPRRKEECKDCYQIWTELSIANPLGERRPDRPATKPGPRCTTHDREIVKRRKELAKDARLLANYGITAEEYWTIYEAQGGRCAFRCRATGKTKRLAVDHDHGGIGSSRYQKRMDIAPVAGRMRHLIRGLLCGPHNQMLAELGDDPQVFEDIARYLREAPAQRILNPGVVGDGFPLP